MPPITPNSKVMLNLGATVAIAGSVIYGTWTVSQYMARLESKLDTAISQQWTKPDHERFAQKLERANRKIDLIVPDVNDRS